MKAASSAQNAALAGLLFLTIFALFYDIKTPSECNKQVGYSTSLSFFSFQLGCLFLLFT